MTPRSRSWPVRYASTCTTSTYTGRATAAPQRSHWNWRSPCDWPPLEVNMIKFGHYVRQVAASLVLIAAVLGSYAARADQILSDSHLMTGTSVISDVGYTFNVSGPGTLDISLKDQSWPDSSLTDLSFSASTPTNVLGQFNGAGVASYDITSGGTIYAYVTGEASNPASGPAYGVGLYTLDIN